MVQRVVRFEAQIEEHGGCQRKAAFDGQVDLRHSGSGDGIAAQGALARFRSTRRRRDSKRRPPMVADSDPDRLAGNEIGPPEIVKAEAEEILRGQHIDRETGSRARRNALVSQSEKMPAARVLPNRGTDR